MLNKVYGSQMNVFFEVMLTPVEIAYDRVPGENDLTGGSTPAVPMHPPSMGVNNAFDFFYTGEPSGEELAVFSTAFGPGKHINVYLFGTTINMFNPTTGKLDATPLHGFQRTLGDYDTVAGFELCYVAAKGIDMGKVMWTVAHEIGHTGGLIHPRHGSRDNILSPGFPLATPELDERRTMYGLPFPSINSATGRMHSLFIKDECVTFRKEWKF